MRQNECRFYLSSPHINAKMLSMSTAQTSATTPIPSTTVFFDGGCPICSREIAFYQKQSGADTVAWIDITRCEDDALPQGVTRAAAMARFHVQTSSGLHHGAAAFIALWKSLPRFQIAGKLLSIPPLPWLLERAYRIFLIVRPTRKLDSCDICVK